MKEGGFEQRLTRIVAKPLVVASRVLLLVDILRKKFAVLYHLVLVIAVSPAALRVWQTYGPHLSDEHAQERLYQSFHLIAVFTIAFAFSVVLKAVMPWFLYLPYAAEMRALGLLRISTDNGSTLKLVSTYLKAHDKGQKIKIICISGKHLFREPRGEQREAPFAELARSGQLDVVMPVASEQNPTIVSRHESYSTKFRDAAYPKISDLVNEVEASRTFLRNFHNTVTEHNILCFWRVIILSHVCLVQNYFPNADGADSDWAPTFVFEHGEDSGYSYYNTFATMFDLAKKHKGTP